MTTPSKDDVLRIARECGFAGAGTNVFGITDKLERLATAMYAAGAKESGDWKNWVLDHLTICAILSAEHEANPAKALTDLINWHVQVALDPRVSSDAQALVDKGAEDMRERAAERSQVWVNSGCSDWHQIGSGIRALPITPANTEG